MADESILRNGLITKSDIAEIHRIFLMLDIEAKQNITVDSIRQAAIIISNKTDISMDEAYLLHRQMDLDKDGQVNWQDFLLYISNWLYMHEYIIPRPRMDIMRSNFENECLHKGIAGLFSLGHSVWDIDRADEIYIEDRIQTWDYFGEEILAKTQRNELFESLSSYLKSNSWFYDVSSSLISTDYNVIKTGILKLRDLIGVLAYYENPIERRGISEYLLYLFNFLMNTNVISHVLTILEMNQNEILWDALKILTVFAAGPRLSELPPDHDLHPSKQATQGFLISIGALPKIVKMISHAWIEVRNQAIVSLGLIARNNPEAVELILQMSVLPVILTYMKNGENSSHETLLRWVWLVSILYGTSLPKERFNSSQIFSESNEILSEFLVLCQMDEQFNLLANCFAGAAFILPRLPFNDLTKMMIQTLIQSIDHENLIVKRAALQSLRHIIIQNQDVTKALTDQGISMRLLGILGNATADPNLKLLSLSLLKYMVLSGQYWDIISKISTILSFLIANDRELAWEAINVVKIIQDSHSRIAIDDMVRAGIVTSIFKSMREFRETPSFFGQVYSRVIPTYNIAYLHDCAAVLNKFITSGWAVSDRMQPNEYGKHFGQNEAWVIYDVVKLVCEIGIDKRGPQLLKVLEIDCESVLRELMDNFRRMHSIFQNDLTSYNITNEMTKVLSYFTSLVRKPMTELLNRTEMNLSAIYEMCHGFSIKVFDNNNYPSGENHLVQNLKLEDLNFYNIRSRICNVYGREKNIQYIDSKGDRITVDNNEIIETAIFDVAEQVYYEFMEFHNQNNKPLPSPFRLPPIELKLIAVDTNIGFGGSPSSTQYSQWPSQNPDPLRPVFYQPNDMFYRDTPRGQYITQEETNNIQNEFRRVRTMRPGEEGTLNLLEFTNMMSKLIFNQKTIQELFNAMDIENRGVIDFQRFMQTFSLLRSGTDDQKLWIAFRAYNNNRKESLNKQELLQMLKSSYDEKRMYQTDANIMSQVEQVFRQYDQYNTGELSFDGFKQAYYKGQITIMQFWTYCTYDNFHFRENIAPQQFVSCSQCNRQFKPTVQSLIPGAQLRCSDCYCMTPPTPIRNAFT